MTVDEIIDGVLAAEGGYVDDPADAGGETNWGITVAVARANGWPGPMRSMPKAVARAIYRRRYVDGPGFSRLLAISPAIAAEVVDTGVNMGPTVAARMLQRALNALNRQGRDYADVPVDGAVGPATAEALARFMARRGGEGERRLLRLLNAQQGVRYLELAEQRQANEQFLYGWLDRLAA